MPSPQIFETLVTPSADGSTVQLYISDSPRDSESAAIRLILTVQIQEYATPLLAHVQRAAIAQASATLKEVDKAIETHLKQSRQDPFATR
jgi:hypothetical protein